MKTEFHPQVASLPLAILQGLREGRKAAEASGPPTQPTEPSPRELYQAQLAQELRELGPDCPGE